MVNQTEEMFCTSCGSPLSDNGTCPTCGRVQNSSGSGGALASAPYATIWKRILCNIIDGIIVGLFATLGLPLLGFAKGQSVSDLVATHSKTLAVAQMILMTLYLVVSYTAGRGQTLGNRIMKTRVLSEGMSPLSPQQAVVRAVLVALVLASGSLLASKSSALAYPQLIALVDAAWFWVGDKRQMIHDKLARTVVVGL